MMLMIFTLAAFAITTGVVVLDALSRVNQAGRRSSHPATIGRRVLPAKLTLACANRIAIIALSVSGTIAAASRSGGIGRSSRRGGSPTSSTPTSACGWGRSRWRASRRGRTATRR